MTSTGLPRTPEPGMPSDCRGHSTRAVHGWSPAYRRSDSTYRGQAKAARDRYAEILERAPTGRRPCKTTSGS